jgi:hypothetical protein
VSVAEKRFVHRCLPLRPFQVSTPEAAKWGRIDAESSFAQAVLIIPGKRFVEPLGYLDRVVILQKPFENIEILQLAVR